MGRRTFNAEFKLEAIRLVPERGVAVRQAAKDPALHENVLRRWIHDYT
jgi:transposase